MVKINWDQDITIEDVIHILQAMDIDFGDQMDPKNIKIFHLFDGNQ